MLSSGNVNDSEATTAGVLPSSQSVVSRDAQGAVDREKNLEEKVIQNSGLDSVLAKVAAFYPELSITLQTQLSFAMFNLNSLRRKKPDDFVKSDCDDSLEFVKAARMSNTERNKLQEAIEALMKKSQDTTTNDFNATMAVINTLLDKALKEYQGDAVLYLMRAGYTMYRYDHVEEQAISDIRVAEILYLGRIDKNSASLTYSHLANRMGRLHQASFAAALSEHVKFLSFVPEEKKLLEHQYFIKQVTSLSSAKVNLNPKLSMDLLRFAEGLIAESPKITGVEVKLGTQYTKAVTAGISYLAGILNVPNAKKLPEAMQLQIETAHLSLQFANLFLVNPSLAASMGVSDAKQKTPAELKEERKNLQKMKQLEAKFAEQKAQAEQKAAQLKREEEAAKKLRDDKIAKAKKKKEDFEAKQKADNEKKLAEEKQQEAKQEQRAIRRVMTDILDKIEKAADKQAKKEKKVRAAEEKALMVSADAGLSFVSTKSDSAAEAVTADISPMIQPDEVGDSVHEEPVVQQQLTHNELNMHQSKDEMPVSQVYLAETTQAENTESDQYQMQTGEAGDGYSGEDKQHTNDVNTSAEQSYVAYQPYPEGSFVDATHLTIHGLTEQCEAQRRTIERLTSQQVTSMPVPVPVYVPVHVSVPVPVPLQMPYFGMQGNFNQPMTFPGQANYYQSPQDPYFAQAVALASMLYNGGYQNYDYPQQATTPFYPAEEMPNAQQPSGYYPNPSVSQVNHPSAFMAPQRGRHQHQQNQHNAERKHQPRSRRHH